MKISIAIMAHPKRKKPAMSLSLQLGQYPFSDLSIIWDQKNEEWDTGARALRWGVGRGDWHVVIQDDAVLTPNFYENLVGAINACPEKVLISLYAGTARPLGPRVKHAVSKADYCSWLRHYILLWGVGIAMPSDHIEPMLDFVDDPRYADTLYDAKIGMFYQRNRLPVYYTMPSLVDHNDDTPSLLGHGATVEPRVAHRVATGPLVWNKQVIDI